jgi:hypothetical protein
LPVLHERGYLIPAINTPDVDYERCAALLRESILDHHPQAHVTILTRDQLPAGDQGGMANDWQCFRASPYRETIKLEADMIAAGPIDHWWTLFRLRDVVISTGARDFYDNVTAYRGYRKTFDSNDLPDVYNAITYWRLSTQARDFFNLVRRIFQDWKQYRVLLKYPDDEPTTDVVYAMAAEIMGPETVTLPRGLGPQIVHMKQHVIPTRGHDWTQELVWERDPLRINTVAQWGLVHYHVKSWAREYHDGR